MITKYGTPALLRCIFICIVIASSLYNNGYAQDTLLTVPNTGRLDSVNSTILHQKRYIQVFIPEAYKPGSPDKYDVLYVLDGGNWNISLIKQVQRFVEGEGNMPPTIIVSVMGIDRNVELTPTHLDSWKGSGGGHDFLGYIKNELIPYINQKYPSNGDNTIWGHSLGGMFVLYAMLSEPNTFKSYICVDPSVWWDNCLVAKMAAEKLPAMKDLNATLYISGRHDANFHDMRVDSIETVLKQFAPAGLKWKVEPYENETHSSVRLKTTYDGLKYAYAGLVNNIEFVPMNGIIQPGKPIKLWYFDDTARMHYTLDGTEPTEQSGRVDTTIMLYNPGKVTYKRFTNRSRYDKKGVGEFTAETIKPVTKPKNAIPGGFTYNYYEGEWNTWPDTKTLTPNKTGITDKHFDIDSLPHNNHYALEMNGYLEVKEEGYHMFILQADKGSRLYLGGKQLIEWDGWYTHNTYTYILPLTKGFYTFKLQYLHNNKDFKLALSYLTPGIMDSKNPISIPVELEYGVR